LTEQERNEAAERLVSKYGMQVPGEVASSVFMGQPKVPALLSRAAFRPNQARTPGKHRTQYQQERRRTIQAMIGIAAVSVTGLWLLKSAAGPSQQPSSSDVQTTSSSVSQQSTTSAVSSPQPQLASPPTSGSNSGQLLANATNIPADQSLTFNDPALGPIVLIHLDNGQFVAYSAICTHAGCQVQFDPSAKDLICPCHGAVYDPYNNAQVLSGPAPFPLQGIPIQYDPSTGNIYLTS